MVHIHKLFYSFGDLFSRHHPSIFIKESYMLRLGYIAKGTLILLSVLIFFGSVNNSLANDENNKNFAHFQAADYEYVIGPGDTLEILVWKEPDGVIHHRIKGRF